MSRKHTFRNEPSSNADGFTPSFTVLCGDALKVLKTLPTESVHCCVTSPPYYGTRDYGTGKWQGGDASCDHKGKPIRTMAGLRDGFNTLTGDIPSGMKTAGNRAPFRENCDECGAVRVKWEGGDPNCDHLQKNHHQKQGKNSCANGRTIFVEGANRNETFRNVCGQCGAVRVDRQIGLEETPEEYIERLVAVFCEVKRVLRDDGTLWINIGDCYATGNGGNSTSSGKQKSNRGSQMEPRKSLTNKQGNPLFDRPCREQTTIPAKHALAGYKTKDLIGIPWMLAFALRANGWYLRQENIWAKPSPMPESVRDRCTKSHESVFLFSKQEKYYFDQAAIAEPAVTAGLMKDLGKKSLANSNRKDGGNTFRQSDTRNKRTVWTIAARPCKEAHFAVFPPELPETCLLAGSPEGGVVLDVFNGVGTTGVAAVKNGRSYLGIELNPDYVEMTRRKVRKELGMEISTTLDGEVQKMNKTRRKSPYDGIPASDDGRKAPSRYEFALKNPIDRDEHGRRLIDCVTCPAKRTPEAAFGLCYTCYRREKRAQKPKTHMHAQRQQKEQIRMTNLYTQILTGAIGLGMDDEDIRQLQMLLQPYLDLVPRLLNTSDIGFLFEDDSEDPDSVNSSQAAASSLFTGSEQQTNGGAHGSHQQVRR